MTGAVVGGNFVIVGGMLGGILYHQGDRRAGRQAVEDTGENLDAVRLLPRCCETARARLPAIQIFLNVSFRECKTCGAAVDHNAERLPVRFPPCSNPEYCACC